MAPSQDQNRPSISAKLISEQIEKENARSESGDNRINIVFCLIGIYASVIIATVGVLFNPDIKPTIILKFFFVALITLLAMSVLNSLKTILVKQVYELSPELINDIQCFSEMEALQYEIKWKMWQYNKLNESNMIKLFCLHRVQRNLFFSILYLLIMAILIYFNDYIYINELKFPCLFYIEFGIGIISLLLSVFLNNIFKKYSYWN